MRTLLKWCVSAVLLVLVFPAWTSPLHAATSQNAQQALSQILLGKDVKALLDMPAHKEGIDIYYTPPSGKRTDERGLDLDGLTKYLKSKGVALSGTSGPPSPM